MAPPAGAAAKPPIHIRAIEDAPEEEAPIEKPEQRPAFKLGVMITLGVVVLVIGVGGYFGWKTFLAPPPPAPVVAKPKPKAGTPGSPAPGASAVAGTPAAATNATAAKSAPTPSETLNALASAPINAINRAQESLAARRNDEQARVDALVAGQDPPDKRALNTPLPANLANRLNNKPDAGKSPVSTVATTDLAPGVTASVAAIVNTVDASPAFRSFVANLKISGVFQGQGKPARAFINGRIVQAGEVVDAGFGVTFDGIDISRNEIVFTDKSGAKASRKY
jgi:hypothetical protein